MQPFGVDERGCIITEVAADKITPQFKPIVDHILTEIVKKFSDPLDGIYLYGSVATGKAVIGESDLDAILLFKKKPSAELIEALRDLEAKLSKYYESSLRNVGLEFTDVADACSERERYGGLCFLKHLCVCVYGHDLTKDVASYEPSAKVARGFNGDIEQSLALWRAKMGEASADSQIKKLSQSIAKKIIKTGFSLVMPRARSWTTDIHIACETFGKYYPEKALEMQVALRWSKSGSSDREAVTTFVDTFGQWLAEEFQREILAK